MSTCSPADHSSRMYGWKKSNLAPEKLESLLNKRREELLSAVPGDLDDGSDVDIEHCSGKW